jgi:hypothetical protein
MNQKKAEDDAMQSNAPQNAEVAASCCSICGSEAVVCDEVLGEPTLRLGECLRCEHRWTWPGGTLVALAPGAAAQASSITGVRLPPKLPHAA